jgi:hypothetical protein
MKTLKHESTEMSLHVLAYNLRRVMRNLGVEELMRAIRILAVKGPSGLFTGQINPAFRRLRLSDSFSRKDQSRTCHSDGCSTQVAAVIPKGTFVVWSLEYLRLRHRMLL